MKKFYFLFAFALISSFVMAEDIGITTGVGFGISGINKPDGKTPVSGLKASCSYGNVFLDNALNFYVETEYDAAFIDSTPMGINLEIKLGYNLWLSADSGIAFLVGDENYLTLFPEANNLWGCVRPGIMYGIRSKFGIFYGQVDVPVTYSNDGYDSLVYLDVLFKWISTFGFGVGIKVSNLIYCSDYFEKGYQSINITASYGYKIVYVEAEVEIPKNYGSGTVIIPKVGVSIPSVPGLSAYLECNISRIGNEDKLDVIVSPLLGVTYSF